MIDDRSSDRLTMRNFQRGYKNDSGSNFSRGDRRNDRDGRYQANETTYKRSGDKVSSVVYSEMLEKCRNFSKFYNLKCVNPILGIQS